MKHSSKQNIPWSDNSQWQEVKVSLDQFKKAHVPGINKLKKTAKKIEKKFNEISDPIEKMCRTTCVCCEDICCKKATIFFDLKDLFYLYFGNNEFPLSQVTRKTNGDCCHISKSGCRLKRSCRPFICTWYFCPEQALYMKEHAPQLHFFLMEKLNQIKALRNELETAFINMACSKVP
ncbi:MAG: hypothetical protein GY729_09200 [Desulfobacteraceae bacterium]|nr:hypothetical protein [Desulfobacteraceae bacterium]